MDFIDTLMLEKDNLKQTIEKCRAQLRRLPRGTLSVHHSDDKLYYRKYCDGKQESITNDPAQIAKLTSRHTAEEVLDTASDNLKWLNEFLKHYKAYDPNVLAATFTEAYSNITRDAVTSLGFAYTLEFKENNDAAPMHEEHLRHTDAEGNKRRSKSELVIGGLYDLLRIPVEYEKLLVLPNGYEVYPDFTTFSTLRHVFKYHDHVGNLNDPKAVKRTIWKFTHFTEAGLFPFDRVLFTFEDPDGNINMELIKMLILQVMK